MSITFVKRIGIAVSAACVIAALSCATFAQGFRVENVSLDATPTTPNGSCPGVIKFTGKIQASGRGRVTFVFTRSDGWTSATNWVDFEEADVKIVETTWMLGTPSRSNLDGWVVIRTLSPKSFDSNKAQFVLNCQKTEVPDIAAWKTGFTIGGGERGSPRDGVPGRTGTAEKISVPWGGTVHITPNYSVWTNPVGGRYSFRIEFSIVNIGPGLVDRDFSVRIRDHESRLLTQNTVFVYPTSRIPDKNVLDRVGVPASLLTMINLRAGMNKIIVKLDDDDLNAESNESNNECMAIIYLDVP